MVNFVRTLCITIASGLFSFVPKLYKLFYDLAANHNLFSSETLQTFSRNIYVLISVVMLFAFAVKAIESIINPDLLFDSKKGFTSVIKRSAIALVLIVLVPYGFTLFYQVQDEVMSKSLIEKIILGVNIENNITETQNDGTCPSNLAEASGAAQMLASVAIQSVLYPEGDTCTEYEDTNVCSEYSSVINEDVGKLIGMVDNINEKVENSEGNEEYVLTYEWNGLLSVIVGGVLVYMLAIFCLDTALRLIKMTFLELTAPISIIAYIYAGNDILKKWWKEVLGTAMSLFGRVAALAFMIFVLSRLPEFTEEITIKACGIFYAGIINLLIIFATLMFIKEAPSMIDKLFGIKVGGKGGIAGRLGNMAGVGGIAKSAWQTLTKAVPVAAGVAAAGIGMGIGAVGKAIDNKFGGKGQEFAAKVRNKTADAKNSTVGRFVGAGKDAVKAGVNSKGGFVSSMKAATDSVKNSTIGKEYDYELNKKTNQKFNNRIGLDDNGKLINKTFDGAKEGYNNIREEVRKSPLTKEEKIATDNKIVADKVSKTLSKIKDTNSNIISSLDSAAKSAKSDYIRNKIEDLRGDYDGTNNKKMSLKQLNSKIQDLVNQGIMSSTFASNITGNMNTLDHLLSNDDKDLQSALSKIIGPNGEISSKDIIAQASQAETKAKRVQGEYDFRTSISTENNKATMEKIIGGSENLSSEYVSYSGKTKINEPDQYSIIQPASTTSNSSTATSTPSSNQNAQLFSGTNSSNTANNNIPSGYSQTDSGIVVPNGTNASNANTMNSTGESSTGYEIPADGGGYSGGTNNSNASAGSTIVNNTTNNNGASTEQDLSSFFSNLSNDIKNANRETNNILNDQLKSQQSMLDESKKQSRSLDNINSGVDSIKGSVDELGNKMDSYGTSINKNINDLNKKMDDNE